MTWKKPLITAAAWVFCLQTTAGAMVPSETRPPVVFSGDARGLLIRQDRELRDGTTDCNEEAILRVRIGAESDLASNLRAKVRFAGRYSNNQSGTSFVFDDHPSGVAGLAAGESTMDEMWLESRFGEEWLVRAGRMQTRFLPEGIAKQSIDRHNSTNTMINWTDGLMFMRDRGNGWRPQLIGHYNSPVRASHPARPPLDFSGSGSRWGVAAAVDNRDPLGPVVHRGVSLNWLPNALPDQHDGRRDYITLTARGAAAWPLGDDGTRFMLTGQWGLAPNVQSRGPGMGRAENIGTMMGAQLLDLFPKHSVALFYSRAGDGWLLSPDVLVNTSAWEGRYEWRAGAWGVIEIRVRHRREIHSAAGEARVTDKEYYLRWTRSF